MGDNAILIKFFIGIIYQHNEEHWKLTQNVDTKRSLTVYFICFFIVSEKQFAMIWSIRHDVFVLFTFAQNHNLSLSLTKLLLLFKPNRMQNWWEMRFVNPPSSLTASLWLLCSKKSQRFLQLKNVSFEHVTM